MPPAPTGKDIVERARALAPAFAAAPKRPSRRGGCRRNWRGHARSGLARILMPARFGGYGLDFETWHDVVVEISRADASHGWCASLIVHHAHLVAQFPEERQQAVWADGPDVAISARLRRAPRPCACPVAIASRETIVVRQRRRPRTWKTTSSRDASFARARARPAPAALEQPRSECGAMGGTACWHSSGNCATRCAWWTIRLAHQPGASISAADRQHHVVPGLEVELVSAKAGRIRASPRSSKSRAEFCRQPPRLLGRFGHVRRTPEQARRALDIVPGRRGRMASTVSSEDRI